MTAALVGPSAAPTLELFPFGEMAFSFVRTPDGPFFVLRTICEAFGLSTPAQQRRAEKSGWATCRAVTASQVGGGQAREYFCISADSLPLWLGTVSASRVALSVRPKLIDFQRRCAEVLRAFFFEGARVALDPTAISRTEALELALAASRERDALEARVVALEPKAFVADRLTNTEGMHTIAEAANAIGPDIGQNRLFAFLKRERFLISTCRPYQRHIEAGRVVVREVIFRRGGKERASARVFLTPKGLAFVVALWRSRTGSSPILPEAAP